MKQFIVKVQNSISTTHETRMILVYNKDKTIMHQFPAVGELASLPLKSFWMAHIDNNKNIVLDRQVASWPTW